MNEDVRTIYLFKLSNRNIGTISGVYRICCKAVDALNHLNIRNRKTGKIFKHPSPYHPPPYYLEIKGRRFKIVGNMARKLSDMIKEIHYTTETK